MLRIFCNFLLLLSAAAAFTAKPGPLLLVRPRTTCTTILSGTLEDNAVGLMFSASPEDDRRRQRQHQKLYRFRPASQSEQQQQQQESRSPYDSDDEEEFGTDIDMGVSFHPTRRREPTTQTTKVVTSKDEAASVSRASSQFQTTHWHGPVDNSEEFNTVSSPDVDPEIETDTPPRPSSLMSGFVGSLHDADPPQQPPPTANRAAHNAWDVLELHQAVTETPVAEEEEEESYESSALQPPPKGMLFSKTQEEECSTLPTLDNNKRHNFPSVQHEVDAIRSGDISSVVQRTRKPSAEEEEEHYSFQAYRSQLELPTKNEAQDLNLNSASRYRSQLELPTKNEAQELSLDSANRYRRHATDTTPTSPESSTRYSLLDSHEARADQFIREQFEKEATSSSSSASAIPASSESSARSVPQHVRRQNAQLHLHRKQQQVRRSQQSNKNNIIKPDRRMDRRE